jgi:hypothetical protein
MGLHCSGMQAIRITKDLGQPFVLETYERTEKKKNITSRSRVYRWFQQFKSFGLFLLSPYLLDCNHKEAKQAGFFHFNLVDFVNFSHYWIAGS